MFNRLEEDEYKEMFEDVRDDDIVIQFYGKPNDYSEVKCVEKLMLLMRYKVIDKDDNSDSDDLLCYTAFRKELL